MIQRIGKLNQLACTESDAAWNRLWEATGEASPLARAELLELYQDAFCSQSIQRLGVTEEGCLAAGLTLVPQRRFGFLTRWVSPDNPWVQCGGLLVDHQKWSREISRRLAEELKRQPSAWLQFNWVEETAEWEQLCKDLGQIGCEVKRTLQFETGIVTTVGEWDDYFSKRSRSFRKKLKNRLTKLERQGCVKFVRHAKFKNSQEVIACLDLALAIEHKSWKGEQQTSLNSRPPIKKVFVAMMQEFARLGLLEIQFLQLDGKILAFEIGFRSHGTYYSCKIGFDAAFSKFSPGQLLTYFQLRNWFAGNEIDRVDTIGELSQATGKWCDRTLSRYRYTVATRGFSCRALRVWVQLKPLLKRCLRR